MTAPTVAQKSNARVALIWDLDKTYLDTRFESVGALLKIPFESAEEKISYRSVTAFLSVLKNGFARNGGCNLTFISASPKFMRQTIHRKFELDGLEVDALILKSPKRALLRRKWILLRNHVNYKVAHLLQMAQDNPDWNFFCFGDDWELDVLIYILFRDLLNGTISRSTYGLIMKRMGLDDELTDQLWAKSLPVRGSAAEVRVFMHRVKYRPLEILKYAGPEVYAYDSYLQLAARFYQEGWIGAADLEKLIDVAGNEWTESEVWLELASGVRHGLIDSTKIEVLVGFLDRRLPGLSRRLAERLAGGAFLVDGPGVKMDVDRVTMYDKLLETLRSKEDE